MTSNIDPFRMMEQVSGIDFRVTLFLIEPIHGPARFMVIEIDEDSNVIRQEFDLQVEARGDLYEKVGRHIERRKKVINPL